MQSTVQRCSDAASGVGHRGRGDAAGGRVIGAVPCPHLDQDWAHRCQSCTRTGPTAATSAPGLGSSRPHLHQDWAHRCGLGPPLPHLHRHWAQAPHQHRLRPTHRRAWAVGGTVRTHWIPCRAEVSWRRACDSIQHETCRTAAHLMHWRAEVSWRMATLSFPSSWFSRRRAVWHPNPFKVRYPIRWGTSVGRMRAFFPPTVVARQ